MLPGAELSSPLSRVMSGVMRKAMMCESWPVTLMYARPTSKALRLTELPAASVMLGSVCSVKLGHSVIPTPILGVSSGGV